MRARIGALTWLAGEWRERVLEWRQRRTRRCAATARLTRHEEYLIYQTLAGAWPLQPERLLEYLRKALREAKTNTNWIEPNEAWERAVPASRRRSTTTAVPRHLRAVRRARRGARRADRPRPDAAQAHVPGRAGPLPGRRAPEPQPRRPRQPPARRLGAPAPPARRADGRSSAAARDGEAVRDLEDARAPRRRRPRRSQARTSRSTPAPDVCAFTRGDEVLVAVPIRPGATFTAPDGFANVLEGADLGVWLCERD